MKIDWATIEKKSPAGLVSKLRDRVDRGESFQLTPVDLATEAGCTETEALFALSELEKQVALTKKTDWVCKCEHTVNAAELESKVCTKCKCAFSDYNPPPPFEKIVFFFEGEQTRDVRWVLVLHGMNTRGTWQEKFSWMLSRVYGYSIPVAIYKYGMVRPGVLFRFRMRALTAQLIEKISKLSREADSDGFGGKPDVVAHSFGTWLIAHALQCDKNLKVGRLVLLGSILRPDFDWGNVIESGQVEAVMCHRATGDIPVAITQLIIPDSGPSGRLGFNSGVVIENISKGLAHSGFFEEGELDAFYINFWQPFLTAPEGAFQGQKRNVKNWRPIIWLLRARLIRYLIILVLVGIVGFLALIGWLGMTSFFQHFI